MIVISYDKKNHESKYTEVEERQRGIVKGMEMFNGMKVFDDDDNDVHDEE